MMRRLLAAALVLALALPATGLSAELPYDHVWQIEGTYVGDAGTTRRSVTTDRMTLTFSEGVWSGVVQLADVLAIQESSGFTQSQAASITLTLDGTPAEGGTAAAGRFTGVAELRTREAASLDDALSRSASGALAVYDVSGFWAARLDQDVAEGQIVYQSARRRAGSKGPLRDAEWFNRASEEGIDATGQPQPFMVAVEGIDPASGGSNPTTSSPAEKPVDRPSFFHYVARGLRGAQTERPLTVGASQAAAARALKDARPGGATQLPADALAIDGDVSGAYLDAKNRAAGLLDERMVPSGAVSDRARAEVKALYDSAPGRRAPGESVDASTYYRDLLSQTLKGAGPIDGVDLLLGDLANVTPGADTDTVVRLRALLAAAESVAGGFPARGNVVSTSAGAAERVASAPIPQEGPLADAVLAAADDPATPASARDVARFEPVPSLDASGTAAGSAIPNRVLAVAGSDGPPAALSWSAGASTVQPESWLAYRRADGAVYWLAGPAGQAALTDSTLSGWAWRSPRSSLVDPSHVGRVYERYALP